MALENHGSELTTLVPFRNCLSTCVSIYCTYTIHVTVVPITLKYMSKHNYNFYLLLKKRESAAILIGSMINGVRAADRTESIEVDFPFS